MPGNLYFLSRSYLNVEVKDTFLVKTAGKEKDRICVLFLLLELLGVQLYVSHSLRHGTVFALAQIPQ